ncbi:MAG: zinc-dependent metalloprotease, partial [Phycisphaerae bacterium]|nr:zinc-dependent metalloprotease [Phycisphaerae bacterium]
MNFKNLKTFALGLLLLSFVLSSDVSKAAAAAGPGTQPPQIFQPAPIPPEAASSLMKVAPAPWVVKSEPKLVNLNLLVTSQPGARLNLNLLSDASFLGVVERIERRAQERLSISGHLHETPDSSFFIVVNEDVAVGIIRTNLPNELYQIHYLGSGAHMVSRMDPRFYPPEEDECVPTDEIKSPGEEETVNVPVRYAEKSEDVSESCTQPETVFDVLMAYTNLARQAMGGTNAAIAQCQLAIDVANDAYDDSQVTARMRLVHTMEVDFNEPGDQCDWLDWLDSQPAVTAARNTYGADFVNMLTSTGSGCGRCNANESRAYTVARWDRAVNTWTLAHETGHNIGCQHNREDAGCTGIYTYSYGWHFIGNSSTHWGTVMSYKGTRISHFSHPGISFDGQPTGVPIGDPNEAHNAQTIINRSPTCEGFRLTRYDIWVEFSAGPGGNGTFSSPYNTLNNGVSEIITPG